MRRLSFGFIRDYFWTFFFIPRNSLIINDLSQHAILEYQHFVSNKSLMQLLCIRHILLYFEILLASDRFCATVPLLVNHQTPNPIKPMKIQNWTVSDITGADYLGPIEFQDNSGEWHNFEVLETSERLVFGGTCNAGFLESGYIEKDGLGTDETLQGMLEDLESYYNNGPESVSCIVCNERM